MFRYRFFALVIALAMASAARAESNLQTELDALAKDVKDLIASRNQTAVQIGQFVPVGDTLASAGPAFAKGLAEALKKVEVDVKLRGADITVSGRYRGIVDNTAGEEHVGVEVTVKFEDKQGNAVGNLSVKARGVFGDSTVSALLGVTADLPPGNPPARKKALEQAIEQPSSHTLGTVARSGAGSPFGVEVQIKAGAKYAPRPLQLQDGLAFAPIARGESYGVMLINDAPHETAVKLSIDGLTMFAISEVKKADGTPKYEQIILPAKGKFLVRGWHISNEKSEEFLITEYAKSVHSLVQSSATTGTITATFAAAWPKGQTPPPDEPVNPSKFARSAGDATGRGAAFGQKFKEVDYELGVTRAAVSVRYAR